VRDADDRLAMLRAAAAIAKGNERSESFRVLHGVGGRR
jgi:hypothetical protein